MKILALFKILIQAPLPIKATLAVATITTLSFAAFPSFYVTPINAGIELLTGSSSNNSTIQQSNNTASQVLAESTSAPSELKGKLEINVPTLFNNEVFFNAGSIFSKGLRVEGPTEIGLLTVNEEAIFNKDLTAPNVIYSLLTGTGIGISSGQTPTITNTGVTSLQGSTGALTFTAGSGMSISGLTITNNDKGSSQNIFKTITVGSTSFSAGSNTDTLTFASGTGVNLAIDTTNKKLTFSSTGGAAAWSTGTGTIYPTTITDSIGIGTTAPSYLLDVAGTGRYTSQLLLTGSPSSSAAGAGSIYINPASATADYTLFGLSVGGTEKLRIDAEGDIHIQGSIISTTPGTVGYWSRVSTNTYLGNSGDLVGIGTSAPAAGIEVVRNGAASLSGGLFSGTWYSGGSSTTTKPQLLVEPSGTTSTGWSTSGTGVGVNSASSFAGNLLDLGQAGNSTFKVAGVSSGVNGFTFTTGATGSGVNMSATGSDTNIGLTVDSKGTGAINLGTGASAKTITIGNNTGATALAFTSGTGSQTFTSSVVSTATTSSAWVFTGNALTTGTGAYFNSSSLTTGKLVDINTGSANTLTSGTLLNLASVSTGLTTGSLISLDWSPGSTQSTAATGNLFNINIGANATNFAGNLFNVADASSSIFSISKAAVTSALPLNITAPGDSIFAYDIQMTNPTSSFLKSTASLVLQAGEAPNSSNLTLKTYNQGSVVFDSAVTTGTGIDFTNSTVTTGTGLYIAANALTTGNATNIVSTSTAGGASGASYLLNLSRSGANSNTAHTAYGLYSAVTNTNATSGTNTAGYFSASGATTANYAIYSAAGQNYFASNGAASTPVMTLAGTWFTGGTSTTTKPQLLIEPSGTTSTGWSTSGTGLGINAASGFAGNLLDSQVAGVRKFKVDSSGNITGPTTGSVTWNMGDCNSCAFSIDAGSTGNGTLLSLDSSGNTTVNADVAGTVTIGPSLTAYNYWGSYSAERASLSSLARTLTISGGYATQRFNLFNQPTITAASALSISSEASTINIAGAPISAGSATIANAYGLKIDSGTSVASGVTNAYGLYVAAPTGATNNYAATFATGNVGIGTTAPGSKLQINTTTANTTGALIKSTDDSTTKNLLEIQDSAGTAVGFLKLTSTTGGAQLGLGDGFTITKNPGAYAFLSNRIDSPAFMVSASAGGTVLGYFDANGVQIPTSGAYGFYGEGNTISHNSTTGNMLLTGAGGTINGVYNNTATSIFGVGEAGTPTATTLRGAAAAGTNIAGANLTFDASNGTGTGGSGALIFRTAPTGSTGSTANTLAEIMRITPGGNVGIGTTNPSNGKFEVAQTEGSVGFYMGTGDATIADGSLAITDDDDASSFSVTNNTLTTATLSSISSTSMTTGTGLAMTFNALTTGKGLNVTSTSTALTTGNLINLDWSPSSTQSTAATGNLFNINIGANATNFAGNLFNVADASSSIFSISKSAVTTSLPVAMTAPGDMSIAYDINMTNPTASFVKSLSALTLQAGESFNSSDLTLKTYNQGSVVFDSAVTTGTAVDIQNTTLTTGYGLSFTGPSSTGITGSALYAISDIGSAGKLVNLAPDFSGSAVTGYGIYNAGTDSTANANTNYGYYGSLTLTGNAAKNGYGIYQTVTSSSTTADTIASADLATSVTGIMTTGTRNIYGLRSQPANSAASTGGTTNVYGVYSKAIGTIGAGGTVNSYGLYIANPTMDTTGTSTKYGLYVEDVTASAADTNYAAIFAGGNVGIGTTTPTTALQVAGTISNVSGDFTIAANGGAVSVSGTGLKTSAIFPGAPNSLAIRGSSDNNGRGKLQSQAYTSMTSETVPWSVEAQTLTFTGAYATQRFWNYEQPTLSAASALTITNADTVSIAGAPTVASSALITNAHGLRIAAGTVAAGVTNAYGLAVAAPTGATNNYSAIFTGGNVGIGTTAPSAPFEVKATGTGTIAKFTSDNTTGCTLADGGTISCSSDRRLKKNIESLPYGLDTLMALNAVEFNWNSQSDGTTKSLGFIAQEVETVVPNLVMTDPSNGQKQLNTIGLVPILAKSLQQQQAQIKNNESRMMNDGEILHALQIGAKQVQDDTKALTDRINSLEASLSAVIASSLRGTSEASDEAIYSSTEIATGSSTLRNDEIDSSWSDLIAQAATASADPSFTIHHSSFESLKSIDTTISGTLKSLGKTYLGDTTIAGDFSVEGTLSLTGSSINSIAQENCLTIEQCNNPTIGVLYIQDSPLATVVDFFNGQVKVTKEGTISAQKLELSDKATGTATMKDDTKQIWIETTAITEDSKVLVTALEDTATPLYVTDKIPGQGFNVKIRNKVTQDIDFDWLIVDSKEAQEN